MMKKQKYKICWNMAYQVCNGMKNFGVVNAKAVAKITGTDVLTWIDPEKSGARKQFFQTIIQHFGITRVPKQSPNRRGGKK